MEFVTYTSVSGNGFPETIYKILRTDDDIYIAHPINEWKDTFQAPSAVVTMKNGEWKCDFQNIQKQIPDTVINALIAKVSQYHALRNQ
jgi:hypothetical protein